jgi:hypothetical protein
MTKNGEKIREELRKEVIDTLLRSAKRNENKTFVYLSDIDGIGPSYTEKIYFLESLKKSGMITKFKEVKKTDELEKWDGLEIERDPEGWIDHKENFSPEERIYAEVSFDPKKIDEMKKKGMFDNKIKSLQSVPSFKKEESKIYIGTMCVQIPIGTIMFHFCKTIFDVPIGNFVSEETLLDEIERAGTKENTRTVYDAMNRVNRIVRAKIGIKKMFEREKNNFRIIKEIFE